MIAYYAPNNKSQEGVAEWLELRSPWAAKDYMTGMRNFSGMKVMQIISKIREIDAKSKGLDNPNTPPGELMKELIFYILHWFLILEPTVLASSMGAFFMAKSRRTKGIWPISDRSKLAYFRPSKYLVRNNAETLFFPIFFIPEFSVHIL